MTANKLQISVSQILVNLPSLSRISKETLLQTLLESLPISFEFNLLDSRVVKKITKKHASLSRLEQLTSNLVSHVLSFLPTLSILHTFYSSSYTNLFQWPSNKAICISPERFAQLNVHEYSNIANIVLPTFTTESKNIHLWQTILPQITQLTVGVHPQSKEISNFISKLFNFCGKLERLTIIFNKNAFTTKLELLRSHVMIVKACGNLQKLTTLFFDTNFGPHFHKNDSLRQEFSASQSEQYAPQTSPIKKLKLPWVIWKALSNQNISFPNLECLETHFKSFPQMKYIYFPHLKKFIMTSASDFPIYETEQLINLLPLGIEYLELNYFQTSRFDVHNQLNRLKMLSHLTLMSMEFSAETVNLITSLLNLRYLHMKGSFWKPSGGQYAVITSPLVNVSLFTDGNKNCLRMLLTSFFDCKTIQKLNWSGKWCVDIVKDAPLWLHTIVLGKKLPWFPIKVCIVNNPTNLRIECFSRYNNIITKKTKGCVIIKNSTPETLKTITTFKTLAKDDLRLNIVVE